MMTRTHVILDGLQDLELGQSLSARWARMGFSNGVDVAGQCAWFSPMGERTQTQQASLSEQDIGRAASVARAFGLEIHDRLGRTFIPANDLGAMRQRIVYEYKSRLATALVFGLPALALHYGGHALAGEGGDVRSMMLPWLFELLLVAWVCISAGWPILWQGALSAVHLRASGDLLTSVLVLTAFVPSAVGVLAMPFVDHPWLVPQPGQGPMFYAAGIVIVLAVLQRWLFYRQVEHVAGRAVLMIRRFSRLIAAWLVLAVINLALVGWESALAWGMLLPPMIGLGAINRLSPGVRMVLPVVAFAVVMWMGPAALAVDVQGLRIEIAAGFVLMMVFTMNLGWKAWRAVGVVG